jgi:flagellar hook-associated protein 3 FlgL
MATTSAGKAAFTNTLASATTTLSAGLDKVLSARSTVGANLQELDYLDTAGSSADVQYASTLQTLTGLDMAKAISQYSQQTTALDAAQKSFKAMSSLSLFNYI